MDTNNLEKRKSNNFIIIILILIILGLIALVCYLFFSKKEMENNNQLDIPVEKSSIKMDNTKDYIFDAEYLSNNKYYKYGLSKNNKLITNNQITSKETFDTVNIIGDISSKIHTNAAYLSDLKVPFINIDSIDAKKVNKELETLYRDMTNTFETDATEKDDDIRSYDPILNYQTYISNDILSIITYSGHYKSNDYEFTTYNFDLKTGDLISYEEALTKLNYNKNDVDTKIKQFFKNDITKYIQKNKLKECKEEDFNKDCYTFSLDSFNEDIEYGNILFYIKNNKINLLLASYLNEGKVLFTV